MKGAASRIAALVLALALAASACGADDPGSITVYSGRSENLIGPLIEQFTEATGIEVAVRYADSAELALLIDEEGERSPADVFISQSPGAVGFLAERGRLQQMDEGALGLVDARFRSSTGLWVGLSGRVRVLVYNHDLVDPTLIQPSVLDLAAPSFAGQVAVAPTNGSFQDWVTALRQVIGDDAALAWLRGMAENGSPVYANNTAIVQAVARGEVPMGLVNHYYNFRLLSEDPGAASRNYFFPPGDIGGLLIVTAAGFPAASENHGDAVRFVEFLLGEEAQTFFATETFEYPLAAGVAPVIDLPALDDLNLPEYDVERLGGGLERTTELISESGLAGP